MVHQIRALAQIMEFIIATSTINEIMLQKTSYGRH